MTPPRRMNDLFFYHQVLLVKGRDGKISRKYFLIPGVHNDMPFKDTCRYTHSPSSHQGN
jgi:hypothetical protein